jgi:L-lactate dehydrogenase
MKIGMIGAGRVGSAALLSVVMRGCAREIVVVNRDRKRARGVATDIQYGASLSSVVDIRDGEYSDLTDATLVLISAGANEQAGGATDRHDAAGRLRLLEMNADVYREILPPLFRAAPNAVILVLTDPPDPLADLVRTFGFKYVLSSGTFLDSLRFRFHLARRSGVDPGSVQANILGEHGTSEVFVWSSARVAGVPVFDAMQHDKHSRAELQQQIEQEVRYANITIIEGTGASQYGVGMVAARLAEVVLRDERAVIPIGSYNPTYGVTLSMPSVVGRQGVTRILDPDLSDEERQALQRSAETLRTVAPLAAGHDSRQRPPLPLNGAPASITSGEFRPQVDPA